MGAVLSDNFCFIIPESPPPRKEIQKKTGRNRPEEADKAACQSWYRRMAKNLNNLIAFSERGLGETALWLLKSGFPQYPYSAKSSLIIWSVMARERGRWKGPLKVLPLVEGMVGLPSRRR